MTDTQTSESVDLKALLAQIEEYEAGARAHIDMLNRQHATLELHRATVSAVEASDAPNKIVPYYEQAKAELERIQREIEAQRVVVPTNLHILRNDLLGHHDYSPPAKAKGETEDQWAYRMAVGAYEAAIVRLGEWRAQIKGAKGKASSLEFPLS